ncbi:hypothetical protein EDC65_5455 [Stella humosa]|uniref:Uncharacterized protein n=2 Tax=Stella humosa TaxID=94 RepID=A0A3N1KR59_9PROT|nr:hypothetical protein [Stella humosa]ROP80808.1 hypothetical protein EDC65_5455 [Stella humosa]
MTGPAVADNCASLLRDHAFAHLPPGPARDACVARVTTVLEGLPVQEFATAFLEMSLRADRPDGADITFALTRRTGRGARFARFLAEQPFARESAAWSRTAALLADWSGDDAPADAAIAAIETFAIELDLRQGSGPPGPNIFLGPGRTVTDHAFLSGTAAVRAHLSCAADQDAVAGLAPFSRLGEGCRVAGVGLMVARGQVPLRLFIHCRGRMSCTPLIAILREGGAADEVLARIAFLEAYSSNLGLNLDVDAATGRIRDGIGIEIFFNYRSADWRDRAARLFDALSAEGLMERVRGETALSFAGTSRAAPGSFWPRSWALVDELTGGCPLASRLDRAFHSVKVVASAGGVIDVKAYLALRPIVPFRV